MSNTCYINIVQSYLGLCVNFGTNFEIKYVEGWHTFPSAFSGVVIRLSGEFVIGVLKANVLAQRADVFAKQRLNDCAILWAAAMRTVIAAV